MYHHSVIVVLVWSWLQARWTIHLVGLLLNTLVHVFMYYYFSLAALGVKVWWKKVRVFFFFPIICKINQVSLTYPLLLVSYHRAVDPICDRVLFHFCMVRFG
jgi:hypothetical protein